MSFRPRWLYRPRIPKTSTGKEIEWEPLLKIERDEEQQEHAGDERRRKKKGRPETINKSKRRGDQR